MNSNYNESINCSVCQCKHHADDENHCALTAISVGTHEVNPTQCQCTDCMSFELSK